jgi:hypothetical protein
MGERAGSLPVNIVLTARGQEGLELLASLSAVRADLVLHHAERTEQQLTFVRLKDLKRRDQVVSRFAGQYGIEYLFGRS